MDDEAEPIGQLELEDEEEDQAVTIPDHFNNKYAHRNHPEASQYENDSDQGIPEINFEDDEDQPPAIDHVKPGSAGANPAH